MSYPQPTHPRSTARPGAAEACGICPRPWPSWPPQPSPAGRPGRRVHLYLHRSPVLHKPIPGTAAWPQQLVVAVLAGVLFGYAYWRHHRTPGRYDELPWLLSPIAERAARRLARTVGSALSGPSPSGRAVLALPLAGL